MRQNDSPNQKAPLLKKRRNWGEPGNNNGHAHVGKVTGAPQGALMAETLEMEMMEAFLRRKEISNWAHLAGGDTKDCRRNQQKKI